MAAAVSVPSGGAADPGARRFADAPEGRRYEAYLGDRLAGWLDYRLFTGRITLVHTEVPKEFGGRGLGAFLAANALDDARSRGLKVRVICPFVLAYLTRHPEYDDIIVGPTPPAVSG